MSRNRTKIIIGRMGGGIGNQLFMYAASKALSLRKHAKLVLDIGDFMIDDEYERVWMVSDSFHIQSDGIISPKGRTSRKFIRGVLQAIDHLNTPFFKRYLEKRPPSYEESLASQNHMVLEIVGNWQSERYFHDFKDQILNDLQFKLDVPAHTEEILRSIKNEDSAVCLHVRTYCDIKDPSKRKIVDDSYLESAMRLVSERDSKARFYVFADQFEGLSIPDGFTDRCIYVDVHAKLGNQGGLLDLFLMSHCKHFIVANSSFSWWACYLSQNIWGNFDQSDRIAVFPVKNTLNYNFVPDFGTPI
jgi:hypothetical protein